MYHPSLEKVLSFRDHYTIVPIYREVLADIISPIILLKQISTISTNYCILESAEDEKGWGRYSFLGFDPIVTVHCKNGMVVLEGDIRKQIVTDKPMNILRDILKKFHSANLPEIPPFTGGFVGYFSYEMISYAEPTLKLKKSDFDDFRLMLFDKVIAYDHIKQKIYVIVNMKLADGIEGYKKACNQIDNIINLINNFTQLTFEKIDETPVFQSNMSKEEFCELVKKTKEYIANGDIFQAVISKRLETSFSASLLNVYRVLRISNPSPYMYMMSTEEVQYAGTSPETLIKLKDGKLITYPIAGTKRRGRNSEEDSRLEKALISDKKELAEHNMLVDLARNDIGKIAKYSTVKVEEYMRIHKFSKVMHIVSSVSGQIKEDKDAFDAIEVMLPAGTLSGAPKIRACEIIDELEPTARGIYGGAIGYIDFFGNMDTCIAIRTAIKKDNTVFIQSGGGIVADSVPENEYLESCNKAEAIINAIKAAGEVNS